MHTQTPVTSSSTSRHDAVVAIADLFGTWTLNIAEDALRSDLCKLASALITSPHAADVLASGFALAGPSVIAASSLMERIAESLAADQNSVYRSTAYHLAALLLHRADGVQANAAEAKRIFGHTGNRLAGPTLTTFRR